MLRRLRYPLYFVTAAYWLVCVYMTHAPVPKVVQPIGNDKFKHFVGYALLTTLVYLSLSTFPKLRRLRLPLLVLLILPVYAALDELTQPAFGRDCDFYDWLTDAAAIVLVTGFFTLIRGAFIASRITPTSPVETASAPE